MTGDVEVSEVARFGGRWETSRLENLVDCLDHLRVPLNEGQRQEMPGSYPYCGANGTVDHISDYLIDDDVILIAEDGGHFDEYVSRPIAYRMKGRIWVNNHAHVLKAKNGFSQGFLFFSLANKNILPFLASGTRAKLNRREMDKIVVWLPRHEAEQRAIAGVLSDVDELVRSLELLIAKKRAIKQAAMQELLTGRTRLPGFRGEWETLAVGDIADIKNGGTPRTGVPSHWGGRIPWCVPTDITASRAKYLVATKRSVTSEGLASCGATLLPAGTLLLCSRATIGEVKIASMPVATNQGFKSLVCGESVDYEFFYYRLLTLKERMFELATGSTFLEIGKRDVANIRVDLPPLSEQQAIATVLSDIDAEIAALERRLDKARAIKQGVMQQLLTGSIRLPIPEDDAGDEDVHAA